MSPATPVPVIVGVVTLVMPSPATPLSLAGARTSAVGAGGIAVSMASDSAAEGAETLPATSVWVAARLCGPAARAGVVTDQVPLRPTAAVPTAVSPS